LFNGGNPKRVLTKAPLKSLVIHIPFLEYVRAA